jgi:hypothetical protein
MNSSKQIRFLPAPGQPHLVAPKGESGALYQMALYTWQALRWQSEFIVTTTARAYLEERPCGYSERNNSESYRASAGPRNLSLTWTSQGD